MKTSQMKCFCTEEDKLYTCAIYLIKFDASRANGQPQCARIRVVFLLLQTVQMRVVSQWE